MRMDSLFKPFLKQKEFIDATFSGEYKYLLYGGAIRSGKTYVTIAIIVALCKMFPGSRWAIVRKDLPTIKRNILPTFNKIAPRPFCGDVNMSSMTCPCSNGSAIIFFAEQFHVDKDLNRWRGLEVNGFLLEEANELQKDSFHKAQERAGSWVVPGAGEQPPVLILLTCNPSEGWVKDLFYTPYAAETLAKPFYYSPANIFENPFISEDYKESLKNLPEHLYKKFVLGDWSIADDPLQVIPYVPLHERIVKDEAEVARLMAIYETEALGVDIGELGNDKTALAHFRGAYLYEIQHYMKKRVDEIGQIVQAEILNRKINASHVAIDAIGVGAGVWGALKGNGYDVWRVIAGAKAEETFRSDNVGAFELQFKNLKSQLWWKFRQDVTNPESELKILDHPGLIQDLTSVHYKLVGERAIEVEPKQKTIERLGHSPDDGDAAVMGNFVREYPYLQGAVTAEVRMQHEDGSEYTSMEERREILKRLRPQIKRHF